MFNRSPQALWKILKDKTTANDEARFQRKQTINSTQGILSIMAINLVNPFLSILQSRTERPITRSRYYLQHRPS